jgi:hypothetical protein
MVPSGADRIIWNSKEIASGIYLAYLKINGVASMPIITRTFF